MKTILVAVLLAQLAAPALAEGPLDAFAPFCGKTWRGQFTGPDGTASTDVSRWDMILGGKAVRTVHSIDDGVYGGESLVFWDEQAQTLAFVYITTAGFRTDGTMTCADGVFTSLEQVHGNADGITEVRSTGRLGDAGTLEVSSEYRKDGDWIPGLTIVYTEAPGAEVRFD